LKTAELLLERGANIDYAIANGKTALHLAVEDKLDEAIALLLKRKANPFLVD